MKNQFIITVAFITITSFTSQLFAQAASAKTADWDLAKGKGALSCKVVSTDEGCSFNFTKIEMTYKEAGSGQSTGKRQYEPIIFNVSSSDNSVTEGKSPRDSASGQATGKRQHKPMSTTMELDQTQSPPTAVDGAVSREASAPSISEISVSKATDRGAVSREASAPSVSEVSSSSVSGSGMGAGKANFQDLHFVIKSAGKPISKGTCVDGTCDVSTDLPDGDYTMVCSWSWGASNSGSMASGSGMSSGKSAGKRCSVDFLLQIENGDCMAINEKGLPGDKKPKKTTTNNPK